MKRRSVVVAGLGALVAPSIVRAQAKYPDHPIRLVIPFAPAGPTDLIGRKAAEKMGTILGQTWVVDNKAGAAGTIGAVDVFIFDTQGALNSATDLAAQKAWLESAVRASTAPWQVVVFHHPPYSSGSHGSSTTFQWPLSPSGIFQLVRSRPLKRETKPSSALRDSREIASEVAGRIQVTEGYRSSNPRGWL